MARQLFAMIESMVLKIPEEIPLRALTSPSFNLLRPTGPIRHF